MQSSIFLMHAHGGGHHPVLTSETGWVFLLRLIENALHAGPTILSGLLVAGILRAIVTPARLNRAIGDHAVFAPLKLVLLSVMTPVCALGAIPIAAELHRAGVRVANIVTFLITAPVLNVLWIAHGYDAMAPVQWTLVMVTAVVVAVLIGKVAAWRTKPGQKPEAAALPPVQTRLRTAVYAAVAGVNGPLVLAMIAAFVGAAALAALVPHGGVEHRLVEDHAVDLAWLTVVMPFGYLTPEMSVVSAREVFRIGIAPGAAMPMVIGGVGLCLGTFVWLGMRFGLATLARFSAVAVVAILASGFVVQAALSIDERGIPDSHAFDRINSPYQPVDSAAAVVDQVRLGFGGEGLTVAPLTFGIVVLMGLISAVRGKQIEQKCRDAPAGGTDDPDAPRSWMSRPLSSRSLVIATAVILITGGGFGVYVVYPPPDATFAELDRTFGYLFQAISTDNRDDVLMRSKQADRLVGQLQMGAAIRPWRRCDACNEAIEEFHRHLGQLRATVQAGGDDELKDLAVLCSQQLRTYRLSARKLKDRSGSLSQRD